jgi:putative sigma-54 modulation protein
MKIDITGRQIEITPALREFTMEKLRKLEKLLDGPLDVHVVLAVEKHRHLAEIQVKSRTAVLSGAEETGDLYA